MARPVNYVTLDVDLFDQPEIFTLLLEQDGLQAFTGWLRLMCWARAHADPDRLGEAGVITDAIARHVLGADGEKIIEMLCTPPHRLLDEMLNRDWRLIDFVERQHLVEWRARILRSRKANETRWGDPQGSPQGSPQGVPMESYYNHPTPPHPTTDSPNGLSRSAAPADAFAEFWDVYPKKVAKQAAERAWAKAVKAADPSVIIDGARRYARVRERADPKYTKHPATWLNGGCWADEDDWAGAESGPREVAVWEP